MINDKRDVHLQSNIIRESAINQHTIDCTSKVGVKIRISHNDNVAHNGLLNELINQVIGIKKISKQTSYLFRIFRDRSISNCSQSKVMPFCNSISNFTKMKEGMRRDLNELGSNQHDFSCKTIVEYHLMTSTGEVNLDKLF